jgi:hypothetical protein
LLKLACTRKAKSVIRSWVRLLPPQVVALCSTSDIPYSNPVNMMVAKITETQGQYLSFISQYMKVNEASAHAEEYYRSFSGGSPGMAVKTATRRSPYEGTVSGPSRREHQPSSCSAIQGIETSAIAAATIYIFSSPSHARYCKPGSPMK